MTNPSPGCGPAPSLASHVLTGDYFAGKLANTSPHTAVVLEISPPSIHRWNGRVARNWAAKLSFH